MEVDSLMGNVTLLLQNLCYQQNSPLQEMAKTGGVAGTGLAALSLLQRLSLPVVAYIIKQYLPFPFTWPFHSFPEAKPHCSSSFAPATSALTNICSASNVQPPQCAWTAMTVQVNQFNTSCFNAVNINRRDTSFIEHLDVRSLT